jgi:hypothetical protein
VDLAEQFGRLPLATGQEQNQAAGVEESGVQGESSDGGGFAGLARAVEEDARRPAVKQIALPRIGGQAAVLEQSGGVKGQGQDLSRRQGLHGEWQAEAPESSCSTRAL